MSHSQKMKDLLNQAIQLYGFDGVHPAANLLPFMEESEFDGLVADADKNGFQNGIKITKDRLLIDGRNRICASIVLQKDVRVEEFNPSDPIQYVLSENCERRHLSPQQKAIVAVQAEELYQLFSEQSKEQQKESIKARDELGRAIPVSQKIDQVESKPSDPNERKTAAKVAKLHGTNRDYVAKAKRIQEHAPELVEKVKNKEVDLNDAAKVASQRKKEIIGAQSEATPIPSAGAEETPMSDAKKGVETIEVNGYTLHVWHDGAARPTFNTANESIDWAWSTWNPVTGCLHSCPYCYARDIATNDRMASVYPKGFEPVFHPYRLDAPKNQRQFSEQEIIRQSKERNLEIAQGKLWARNVFVCSMADLFGKWVPDEWILRVFESVVKYDQWNYLFLTKYPQRLQEIGEKLGGSFPANCWVGTTVDEQKRVRIAQDAFANIKATVKWLSLEPLLTNLEFTDLGMFDMVAIGGQSSNSQVPAFQPEWSWVENILWQARQSNTSVYFKENLKCRPKELPF